MAASSGSPDARPFVFINVAMTADGKIAPASRRFVPFTSRRDRDLLMRLRTDADAVMAGARTVDLGAVDLGPGSESLRRLRVRKGRSEYNLRVVVSGSGSLDPDAELFKRRFSPIVVLTSGAISRKRFQTLSRVADEVRIFGKSELDFPAALAWLRRERGVKRLLCEGGGEVNEALFRCGLVDEIYVTVAPFIFGGRDAPTLADGIGVREIDDAIQLDLVRSRRVRDELFLVYRVSDRPPRRAKRA